MRRIISQRADLEVMKVQWMKLKIWGVGELKSKGKLVESRMNLLDPTIYQRGSWIWTS